MSAKKKRLLTENDASTTQPGDVVWLKGASVDTISSYVTALATRGLDLFYCGPGDRYIVAHDRGEADTLHQKNK